MGQNLHIKSINSQGTEPEVIFENLPHADIYSIQKSWYQLFQNIQKVNIWMDQEEEVEISTVRKKEVIEEGVGINSYLIRAQINRD